MTRTAHITINSEAVSPSKAIAAAARGPGLLIVTGRMYRDLAAELGSDEAANRHLLRIAENVGKPIGINFTTGADTSSTAFIAPRSWTPDRLWGWIGGKHSELEALFGEATVRGAG